MALVNPGALITAQSTQLTTLTQKKDLKVVFAISDLRSRERLDDSRERG